MVTPMEASTQQGNLTSSAPMEVILKILTTSSLERELAKELMLLSELVFIRY
jgi:hypothetical protein